MPHQNSLSMDLSRVTDRFVQRLHLPPGFRCDILGAWENPVRATNPGPKLGQPVLELDHSSRGTGSLNQAQATQSICDNGFVLDRWSRGNKGQGVYLANHSRYAWLWGGLVVIVCHVDPSTPCLQRYRSEINSGNSTTNSEYVVSDPNQCHARYVIQYKVSGPVPYGSPDLGFTPHGQLGCSKCDVQTPPRRCDCPQEPLVDPNDLVSNP